VKGSFYLASAIVDAAIALSSISFNRAASFHLGIQADANRLCGLSRLSLSLPLSVSARLSSLAPESRAIVPFLVFFKLTADSHCRRSIGKMRGRGPKSARSIKFFADLDRRKALRDSPTRVGIAISRLCSRFLSRFQLSAKRRTLHLGSCIFIPR